MSILSRRRRAVGITLSAALLITGLSACGDDANASEAAASERSGFNTSPDQDRIIPDKIDDIAAKVPKEIRDRGELRVGVGAGGAGFAPLAFVADDNKTLIGSEPDIAELVGGVLGLKVVFTNTSWEDLFVGIDSGKFDVGFSNITDTEERKEKYDFASYREDNLAFEALADADWEFTEAEDLAGKTVAVGSGTNQERILLAYADKVKAAGLDPVEVKYYDDTNTLYLALKSGQIDAYFGPNPTSAYHVGVSGETKIVGTVSGAGESLQGLIAATTPKDSGLAEVIVEALNAVIDSGEYAKVLERWNISNEAVEKSLFNPPGLPKNNT